MGQNPLIIWSFPSLLSQPPEEGEGLSIFIFFLSSSFQPFSFSSFSFALPYSALGKNLCFSLLPSKCSLEAPQNPSAEVSLEKSPFLVPQAGDSELGAEDKECGTWWPQDISALLPPASLLPSLLPSLLDPSPLHTDVL